MDEELTEEALLKQYEELAARDANFGKKSRKKKKVADGGYYDMADELLEDLEQHERDMNEMFRYLEETHEMLRNGQDVETIESMMEVTKDTMTQHIDAY